MYTGITTLRLQDEEIASLYTKELKLKLYDNQYMIINNSGGEYVDRGKWSNENGFTRLKYKSIKNDMFGKIDPRNLEQEFALDCLQSSTIVGTLLVGSMGSGKTLLSLCYALDQVIGSRPRYDKIVFLRNNIEVKNTVPLGALPGGLTEKIKPYAMSLADILGSETELDKLISQGTVVLEHLGFIRGRSYKNSVVILSEAQDTTQEQMALAVARIAENTKFIVEGDLSQCDKDIFKNKSGICALAESLKGDPEFGMVTLVKNERSRFASLSDNVLNYRG